MKKLTLTIATALILTACTTPSPESYLPDNGMTTKNAYEAHMSGVIGPNATQFNPNPLSQEAAQNNQSSSQNGSAPVGQSFEQPWNAAERINILPAYNASLSTSISTELSNFKQDFTKLNNPEIVAYTYPYIDANGNPHAGGFSMFQLYDREQYSIADSEGMIYNINN